MGPQHYVANAVIDIARILSRTALTIYTNPRDILRHALFFVLITFAYGLTQEQRDHKIFWFFYDHFWSPRTFDPHVAALVLTWVQRFAFLLFGFFWFPFVVMFIRLPANEARPFRFYFLFWKKEWRVAIALLVIVQLLVLSAAAANWFISTFLESNIFIPLAKIFGGHAVGFLGLAAIYLSLGMCCLMVFCTISYKEPKPFAASWRLFKAYPIPAIFTLLLFLGVGAMMEVPVNLLPEEELSITDALAHSIVEAVSHAMTLILVGVLFGSFFLELKEKEALTASPVA